jgi:hypothetical protein
MTIPALPALPASGSTAWYNWASGVQTTVTDTANAIPTKTDRYTRLDVVADYGADSTGATSAVTAFNNAITQANTLVGKVEIVIPPGTFDVTAGITTVITKNHVYFTGAGMGVTILNGGSGTLFAFGNGTGTVLGGGLCDVSLTYVTPAATSKAIDLNGASSQLFTRVFCDNVRQVALMGHSSTAVSSAPVFDHIRGSSDPTAGSVVFEAAFGTALTMRDVVVNAKGVGFPADATTLHPANATTFLRFGQGSWDTAHCWGVISNRYDRGLDIDVSGAYTVGNMWFIACVWDYNKTGGIRLQTNNASASLRSVYFQAGWAVATDAYSIQVIGTLGSMKNIHFTDVVARQAGKCNWRFSGGVMDKVILTSCHSLAANRLASTNTGSDQDDLVILGNGVTVLGGSFGEDGSSYVGFTNWARYGCTISADIDARVCDARFDGATGSIQGITNTVASFRRLLNRNRRATNALPEYATATAPAAPTSNTDVTQLAGTYDTLYLYGGTVTSILHNATQVGTTGPATLNLKPGDVWKIIYSVAPTLRRVVAP